MTTQDDIFEVAKASGLYTKCRVESAVPFMDLLTVFYRAAYEQGQRDMREACAQVCDELDKDFQWSSKDCAAAIRARSNT
jgi:hypothetical protein